MKDRKNLDRDWLQAYPPFLAKGLRNLGHGWPEMYVTGGAVRDWLRGETANDLDLTMAGDALAAARLFAADSGGAFVMLDAGEGVARVVTAGLTVDFSCFREGTTTIQDDLARRDFAINALAVRIDPRTGTLVAPRRIIDSQGGIEDLDRGVVRAPEPEVFDRDPLRLLRAFRFAATLNLKVDERTRGWIKERVGLISRPAPERLNYELELIMAASRGAAAFADLAEEGLLAEIFPELAPGRGLIQPASHHLDVLDHNLAALAAMEEVLRDPAGYYPDQGDQLAEYLARPGRPVLLKWGALFHDLGKPETSVVQAGGRTTFYNHDRAGARLFGTISRRLRWSRERSGVVARLIELHMYPFHLNNARQKTGITPRACLRLVKAAGDELPGLFLLALADSLAASGPLKPAGMEESLARLYRQVDAVYRDSVQPVLHGPKLIDGHDLLELGLIPGPLFGEILDALEQVRVAGEVRDRDGALTWVIRFLADRREDGSPGRDFSLGEGSKP